MSDSGKVGQDGQHDAVDKKIYPLDDSGTFWARQRNAANFALKRLGREDAEHFQRVEELKNWDGLLKNCEKRRDYLLNYSPIIRFMTEKVGGLGGKMSADMFPCHFCTAQKSGGFNPFLGIELCANKLLSRSHQEETMAHELIHAYDHLRFEVDWLDLRHSACSEIRASALSGECRFMKEFVTNGQWKVNKGYQDCVRRRALLSVRARPLCKDDAQAEQAVDEVWDSCLMDTRPFDEVYR